MRLIAGIKYIFCDLSLTGIQANDNTWYNALTNQLTSEQQQELNDVVILADQRKAAAGKTIIIIIFRTE